MVVLSIKQQQQQQKPVWNRVDCQRSAKRSKTHKRLKRHFLIGRNRTKRAHFRGCPLSQAIYVQNKNRKTNNQFNLSRVSWMWEAGGRKRARDWPLINCFFSVFMLYLAWKRVLPRKFTPFVLFRPIKKCSFNLLRVLDLFCQYLCNLNTISASALNSSGCGHVVSLFTKEEHRKIGSWRKRHLWHTWRPCSWSQRPRLADIKWQRSRVHVCDFQSPILNKQDHESAETCSLPHKR